MAPYTYSTLPVVSAYAITLTSNGTFVLPRILILSFADVLVSSPEKKTGMPKIAVNAFRVVTAAVSKDAPILVKDENVHIALC